MPKSSLLADKGRTPNHFNDGMHNAVIEKVTIECGDRGFLTGCLHVKYDGGGQVWGGFRLDRYNKDTEQNEPSVCCGAFITAVLLVTGAYDLSKVEGRPIRVWKEGGFIREIGHYLRDEWFNFAEWYDANYPDGKPEGGEL